jgi:hypothetical protein
MGLASFPKPPLTPKEFSLRDGRPRETFSSGAVREQRSGKGRFDLISIFALFRLARIYEKGASKYADRNWEKGMPFHLFIDSAIRHLMQYIMGDTVEDHLGQAVWNLISVMHLEMTHPEFNDLPKYEFDVKKFPEFKAIFQAAAPRGVKNQKSSSKRKMKDSYLGIEKKR